MGIPLKRSFSATIDLKAQGPMCALGVGETSGRLGTCFCVDRSNMKQKGCFKEGRVSGGSGVGTSPFRWPFEEFPFGWCLNGALAEHQALCQPFQYNPTVMNLKGDIPAFVVCVFGFGLVCVSGSLILSCSLPPSQKICFLVFMLKTVKRHTLWFPFSEF